MLYHLARLGVLLLGLSASRPLAAQQPQPPGLMIEAEDFQPQGEGWRVVKNGEGNYMVDIIGFQHISGERLLSAPAAAVDARAVATISIPEAGTWRVWASFETPTQTEVRFRVEIRQAGKLVGSGVFGEKDAPKYWFGGKEPVGQYDASWGSEGLASQYVDIAGLTTGPAEIALVAISQPALAADRNVDFLFLSRDLENAWDAGPERNALYPLIGESQRWLPPRYYLRLTSSQPGPCTVAFHLNRHPWYTTQATVTLTANQPSEWVALSQQDVCHFTTLALSRPGLDGLDLRVEFAGSAAGAPLYRTIDWQDPQGKTFFVSLPPYPGKYAGERIITAEEQYQGIRDYLRAHPSDVGRQPTRPLSWGGWMDVYSRDRTANAAADVYHEIGLGLFLGSVDPNHLDPERIAVARERFQAWGLTPQRSLSLGQYRFMPTPENLALARSAAEKAGVFDLVQRLDFGDEIGFAEWLALLPQEALADRFAAWQRQHLGAVAFASPDSSAAAAAANPELYVASIAFYEDTSIERVAELTREIPKQFGAEVLYGANVSAHPFYYPEIAKYIKWFRGGAATFGRHSEYFWQVGQPGPLVNAYVADHFSSGMRDNPQSVLLQYTEPHSPGNTRASFLRTAFSHLAHGARGLDYFGIGVNYTFTENYIDFRDPQRYADIRDVNRAVATIEDLLPTSRVVPSKVALILSDSTERWDFAPLAQDKAGVSLFGGEFRKLRLCFHLDRLGIYYALIQGSRPPDLLIEEDVIAGRLADYDVAYWVGDCAPPAVVAALDDWVGKGGYLVATAGALRHDQFHRPSTAANALLGITGGELDARETFFRVQIELPRLQPLAQVGGMPVFGVVDRVTAAADTTVVATFADGKPAVIDQVRGQGRTRYIAALPGVSFFHRAYQPAPVPSRGVLSHQDLVHFDDQARALILAPALTTATSVQATGGWLDARLIRSPAGLAIPVANYSADVSLPVTLTIHGVAGITGVVSARHGALPITEEDDGAVSVHYATGYGDILRLQTR